MKIFLLLIALLILFTVNDVIAEEIGVIKWSQNHYLLEESPEIIVTDSDLNTNSTILETVQIEVWSDTDVGGIDLILNETGIDTGVFIANIILSTTEESKGTILEISDGDYITAEYEDSTLPKPPYNYGDELSIAAISYVSNTIPLPFILTTDKPTYYEEETILISGEVPIYEEGYAMTFVVITPNGDIAAIVQMIVNPDRIFNYSLEINTLMKEEGIYTIEAHYGTESTETTFEILPEPIPEPTPAPLTANTDKTQYEYGEILQLTGNIGTQQGQGIVVISIHKDGKMTSPILSYIELDGSFIELIELYGVDKFTKIAWEEGRYDIIVYYGDYTVELEFSISPMITIEADKSEYHQLETIILYGAIHGVTANIGDDVDINVLDEEGDELIPQQTVYFTTITEFNHTIIPDDPSWRGYDGTITIRADYRDYTATVKIDYSDYPVDLSLESLHIKNLEHNSMIDELTITQNTLLSTIEVLTGIIEEFIGSPIIVPEIVQEIIPAIIPVTPSDIPVIHTFYYISESDDFFIEWDIMTVDNYVVEHNPGEGWFTLDNTEDNSYTYTESTSFQEEFRVTSVYDEVRSEPSEIVTIRKLTR